MERIDNLEPDLFYSGPAEYLVAKVAAGLKAVPQFASIFGDRIDAYKRLDYSMRELPAIRLYNDSFTKEFESWFINGTLICDVILPASQRRELLQQVQDTLSAALLQQFRRPSFFAAIEADVPGLNELGKNFDVDKSLGFEWGDNAVPLTQIRLNFRIDLRQWDNYLTSDERTKDEPFTKTLGDLELIMTTIQGLQDDFETINVVVGIEQDVT